MTPSILSYSSITQENFNTIKNIEFIRSFDEYLHLAYKIIRQQENNIVDEINMKISDIVRSFSTKVIHCGKIGRNLDYIKSCNYQSVADLRQVFDIPELQNSIKNIFRYVEKLQLISKELSYYNGFFDPTILAKELQQIEENGGKITNITTNSFILQVLTDEITFEYDDIEVELGRFNIHIELPSGRYCIYPLDENPPCGQSHICHPHVSSNTLCEGDGIPLLKMALKEARILDYVNIIKNILNTYSNETAYVTLYEWYGDTECVECNERVDSENCYSCSCCQNHICEYCFNNDGSRCYSCGADFCSSCTYEYGIKCIECNNYFCDSCYVTCASCSEPICNECGIRCPECHDDFCSTDCMSECEDCGKALCSGCIKQCDECGKDYCNNCLEDGLCRDCEREKENEEE